MNIKKYKIEIVYYYNENVFFSVSNVEAENEDEAVGVAKYNLICELRNANIYPNEIHIASLNF